MAKIMKARLISPKRIGQFAFHQDSAEPRFNDAPGIFSSPVTEERSGAVRGWELFEAQRQVRFQLLGRVSGKRNKPFFVKLGFPKGKRVLLEIHILNFQVQCFAQSQSAGVEEEIKRLEGGREKASGPKATLVSSRFIEDAPNIFQ